MKPHLFNMPNKMIISEGSTGASTDAFFGYAPAPNGTEQVVTAGTLTAPSASLYCTLKDKGYYDSISIAFEMVNGVTPVQKTILWDYWNGGDSLTSKTVSCAITSFVNFTATYSGLELPVSELKIQVKDGAGEIISIPGEDTTTYSYYDCYFQEITTKSDLLYFGYGGIAVDNLYYLRCYKELETLDFFQIQGYEKSAGVLQDYQVYSLIRKIRVPGTSKVIAYDCFCKAANAP
jgi:hypothetical protein